MYAWFTDKARRVVEAGRQQWSCARFTDKARRVVKMARQPRCRPLVDVRAGDILAALVQEPGCLPTQLLERAGGQAPPAMGVGPSGPAVVEQANRESERCGDRHVGTEHLLLALARLGVLAAVWDVTPERLEGLLAEARGEWRQDHPPLARRLGLACRAVLARIRGRA